MIEPFLGTLVGSLVGAFAGAFLAYQFTRAENERLRDREQGESLLNTLHEMTLKWLTEAVGAATPEEIEFRVKRAPDVLASMKQMDDVTPQELAAVEKLASALPVLMREIAATPLDQRAAAFDRAAHVVTDHVAVLRRALRERTSPRAWPFGRRARNGERTS